MIQGLFKRYAATILGVSLGIAAQVAAYDTPYGLEPFPSPLNGLETCAFAQLPNNCLQADSTRLYAGSLLGGQVSVFATQRREEGSASPGQGLPASLVVQFTGGSEKPFRAIPIGSIRLGGGSLGPFDDPHGLMPLPPGNPVFLVMTNFAGYTVASAQGALPLTDSMTLSGQMNISQGGDPDAFQTRVGVHRRLPGGVDLSAFLGVTGAGSKFVAFLSVSASMVVWRLPSALGGDQVYVALGARLDGQNPTVTAGFMLHLTPSQPGERITKRSPHP